MTTDNIFDRIKRKFSILHRAQHEIKLIEDELNSGATGMHFVAGLHVMANGSGAIMVTFTTELDPRPVSQPVANFESIGGIDLAIEVARKWATTRLTAFATALSALGAESISDLATEGDADTLEGWAAINRDIEKRRLARQGR